jgi:hypothetical protein
MPNYFKEKFTTLSVKTDAFKEALAKSQNSGYFRKTGDLYYLTPEGQQKVESWLAGMPINCLDESGEDGGN